jgi:hypothetical protein
MEAPAETLGDNCNVLFGPITVAAAVPGLAVTERISFELDTGAVHDMPDVMTSNVAVEWENTLQGPVDSAAWP